MDGWMDEDKVIAQDSPIRKSLCFLKMVLSVEMLSIFKYISYFNATKILGGSFSLGIYINEYY